MCIHTAQLICSQYAHIFCTTLNTTLSIKQLWWSIAHTQLHVDICCDLISDEAWIARLSDLTNYLDIQPAKIACSTTAWGPMRTPPTNYLYQHSKHSHHVQSESLSLIHPTLTQNRKESGLTTSEEVWYYITQRIEHTGLIVKYYSCGHWSERLSRIAITNYSNKKHHGVKQKQCQRDWGWEH